MGVSEGPPTNTMQRLRKEHLLSLCRLWNYKSDLWRDPRLVMLIPAPVGPRSPRIHHGGRGMNPHYAAHEISPRATPHRHTGHYAGRAIKLNAEQGRSREATAASKAPEVLISVELALDPRSLSVFLTVRPLPPLPLPLLNPRKERVRPLPCSSGPCCLARPA